MKSTHSNTLAHLVNEFEAAKILGVSVHTLRKDRLEKKRFPFVKFGTGKGRVRYDVERIRATLKTMEIGGAGK